MKEKTKIIPELQDVEEPDFSEQPQGKTDEEKLAELAKIEAEEAAEEKKLDEEDDLEDGEEAMTEEELQKIIQTEKSSEKKLEKNFSATASHKPVKAPKNNTPASKQSNQTNIIAPEKTLLYKYPSVKEWEKIHEQKPKRIIFYFTMTKEEYKELFLCQVRYGSKIIGSTGARVI